MSSRIPMAFTIALLAGGLSACRESTSPLSSDATLARGDAAAGRLELVASFSQGDAKARFRSRGNEQELQVEVEDLRPGTTIDILVGGILVGQETADALGNTNLNHNTQVDGPFPAGFAVAPGTTVIAQVAGGSAVVAQGAF